MSMWKVISNSLDINFTQVDILGWSRKEYRIFDVPHDKDKRGQNLKVNNICEIKANPASGYSGTEPYVNRWTYRRQAPYHITIDFRPAYENEILHFRALSWKDS